MKIKAILVVPAEGDPHGLLREGPCGARPPMAYQEIGTRIWRPYCGALGENHPESNDALVLAWDGEPVPVSDGWLRCSHITVPLMEQGRGFDVLRDALADVGKVVLLDAEGREVSDE